MVRKATILVEVAKKWWFSCVGEGNGLVMYTETVLVKVCFNPFFFMLQ